MMSPGISRNTVSSEQTMPLASTVPRSRPSRNCISISATSPATVVRLEDEISMMDLASASTSASRYESWVSASS